MADAASSMIKGYRASRVKRSLKTCRGCDDGAVPEVKTQEIHIRLRKRFKPVTRASAGRTALKPFGVLPWH
jgi:hypothetical protein